MTGYWVTTACVDFAIRPRRRRLESLAIGIARGWVIPLGILLSLPSADAAESVGDKTITVQAVQGVVHLARGNDPAKYPARTNDVLNAGDRLSTGEKSQAQLLWYDRSVLHVDQLSLVEIPPLSPARHHLGFRLLQGLIYFFHRDAPEELEFQTPRISAVVKGTEFALRVAPDGTTLVTVFEGAITLSDAQGASRTVLKNQQGIAREGQPLEVRPMIGAVNDIIQWFLYYPGILDVEELPLNSSERDALTASLQAYDQGNLLRALALYPSDRTPDSAAEALYLSALLLSVGQVDDASARLDRIVQATPSSPQLLALSSALKTLIATVKLKSSPPIPEPRLATEWMVESYRQQSSGHLAQSLAAARQAVAVSPSFGFAWARVAELEFSHGRVPEARRAVQTALTLSPQQAEALSLRGFLLGAEGRVHEAIGSFARAIEVDPGLANAWLGRGLCRIRLGERHAGQADLLAAASLEPQRASLRSYLAKAYADAGEAARAEHELELAKQLDSHDPTPFLYSALLLQQRNRINPALSELERSRELNDNRRLYRSQFLLDQDKAVASANLAGIYADAGMTDTSLREASHAVAVDYANYSSHLFLANSYNALRDPRQIDLRYETPWQSEYLLAQLLGPVGGGTLSPYVTQQEYSKFFERDRLGLSSRTEYLSSGDWFEAFSVYGQSRQTSFAVDTTYRTEQGDRANSDLEQLNVDIKMKGQLSPKDSIFLQSTYYKAEAGDVSQLYNPQQAILGLRVKETQEPVLLAGYHHEWSPGHHTLFLAGRLEDTLSVTNPLQSTFWIVRDPQGLISDSGDVTLQQNYRSQLEIYLAELQQIGTVDRWTWIGGVRYQVGEFRSRNGNTVIPFGFPPIFSNSFRGLAQDEENDFQRASAYGYLQYALQESLILTAGLTYDRMEFPSNYRFAPIAAGGETIHRLSPKAGLIWEIGPVTRFRGAFTRSQGGTSLDQSYQLEPSQVSGFQQSFRSLIPESVASANAGARFETFGVALDHKFSKSTFLGISGEILNSQVSRDLGVLDLTGVRPWSPAQVREGLDYQERTLAMVLNQLIDEYWSLGGRYQITDSGLDSQFPEPVTPTRDSHLEATLHQVKLFAIFTHPCGFFSQVDSVWSSQSNRGYGLNLTGDDFWQFNAHAGYRLWRRRAEVRLGVLNLTDRDYQLNPLNLTSRLPRERTFVASFRLNF